MPRRFRGDRRRDSRAAHAVASSAWILAVALSVALGLPLVRVLIALLYGLRESHGAPIALSIAAAVFSTPMLAVALRRAIGRREERGERRNAALVGGGG